MSRELKVGDYLCYADSFGKNLVKVSKIGDDWFDFVVVFSDDKTEIGLSGTDRPTYHYIFIGDSDMKLKDAINIVKGMK